MNGVVIVNKEKGYTSRDVVNIVGKCLGTKKVGHTGTLDPMAVGVLVLCVGKSLKLVEMMMDHDKEYIAKIKLGIETDTLDITGNVVKKMDVFCVTREQVIDVLNSFVGESKQEVPKYSAIKVNGRKLYEYARNGEEVLLPIKDICVYDIELISDIVDNSFYIRCSVSKGTYIRSLVRDIGYKLGVVAVLEELERVKLGNFSVDDSYTLEEIKNGEYKMLDIKDVIDLPKVVVDDLLEFKIRNGQVLKRFFEGSMVMVVNKRDELLAIYESKDDFFVKPYRMFV